MKKPNLLSSALQALFGTGSKTPKAYKKITAIEAQEMINSQKVIILDVRTKDEYDARHIPNAVLLPLSNIKTEATKTLPHKDAIILVHCHSGTRSANAAKVLASMDYTNIYNFGGIIDWKGKIVQ